MPKRRAKKTQLATLPKLESVDIGVHKESEPISEPVPYKTQSRSHLSNNCSCCDWSLHKGHIWWILVIFLLICFAGVASVYLLREGRSLKSEIESSQINQSVVLSKSKEPNRDIPCSPDNEWLPEPVYFDIADLLLPPCWQSTNVQLSYDHRRVLIASGPSYLEIDENQHIPSANIIIDIRDVAANASFDDYINDRTSNWTGRVKKNTQVKSATEGILVTGWTTIDPVDAMAPYAYFFDVTSTATIDGSPYRMFITVYPVGHPIADGTYRSPSFGVFHRDGSLVDGISYSMNDVVDKLVHHMEL